jgi:hypothetical protein
LILLKLALPLLVFAWCAVRGLWVKSAPPDGIPVAGTDAAPLWGTITELERDLQTPRIHQVLLTDEFNAAIGRYPRLGLLGWHSNVLFLGMPWLLASSPDRMRAVIAHELAHLSRKHNWTTRLVWRACESADRVQASLATTYHSSQLLAARFFKWYRPALARRATALSRTHEFEADRLAAEMAGPELAGQALLESQICDALLDEQFWPEIGRRYDRGEGCPEYVFGEMREFLSTRINVSGAQSRLDAALADRSDPFSSHPSLSERLAALGVMPHVPALRPSVTAASHFFKDRLEYYLERLSDEWRAARADAWEERAAWLQQARPEISGLEAEETKRPLEFWELERLARLRALVHGRESAARQDVELLERDPDHLGASWRLGLAGLEAGHAHGLPLILRVMARDWRAIPAGTSAIRDAAERGVIELTSELKERLQQLAETYHAVDSEFAETTHFDLLEPHGLDAATVQRLTDLVNGFPQIRQAYLARKRLKSVPDVAGLVLGVVTKTRWTSELLATDFGADGRLAQELADRADLAEFMLVVSLSDERLLKNRMKRVPSATLVSRPWYDLSPSAPGFSRRAALAGFAAAALGGVLAWDGTHGWPGSRRAVAWVRGTPDPEPSSSAPPLVLDGGLFAMAPFLSAVHGGLEAAYRAHSALDAALATAVAYWQGRQEKTPARQRLMAHRDEARLAEQRLAGYLGMIEEWHASGAAGEPVTAALRVLDAHDREVRNNMANVVILLNDEIEADIHGRLVRLHFVMRGQPIEFERELVRAVSSALEPSSPERAFLDAMDAVVDLQRDLLRLTLELAGAPEGGLAEMVDDLDAMLSPPSFAPAVQFAVATRETLRRLAAELAAESGLGLTTSEIEALAETYATTGRAALDAFNVGLHVRSDLRMMLRQGNADPAIFLGRAIEANRELNSTLAHRGAAAKARFDWMMDLAGSRSA